jgi:two-component sensor histidine kinase
VNTTEPLTGTSFALEGKSAMMERALSSAGISILFQDTTLALSYAENLPPHLAERYFAGGNDGDLFGKVHGDYLEVLKSKVLETGTATNAEIDIDVDGEIRTFELKVQRVNSDGFLGILSVISEVTETHHREKVLKSLLRELSHRSKNLLAIIQGIATQTARNTLSLDSFLVKFRGRLQSLSHSQDLITDSSWRGAYLFDLAEKQFAPYWPETAGSMPIFGINAHMTPNAAVHLGLALHELIVNSASYGAIARGASSITLNCKEVKLNGKKAIEVAWVEALPDRMEIHEFSENSFGRSVLERVVPSSMNGKAELKLIPGRIEYCLQIPETEFEILKRI